MILKFGAFDKKILSNISTSLLARVIIVVDKVDILEMQAYGIPLTKKVVEAKKRSLNYSKTAMTVHISPLTEFSFDL